MHKAICNLTSVSPYGQGKYIREKKSKSETHAEFEERSWRLRMHSTADGHVFIPPMSFKNCLSEAAKYKSVQIPGQGKKTYTAKFEAGLMVVEPLVLPNLVADVEGVWLHLPSDGRRGGSTRVEKCMPMIPEWSGTIEFNIFDEIVNEEVFTDHLTDAGKFIGIGFFRPRNNGYWGRFSVDSVNWIKGS